jgi:hypothetical protein
MMKPLAIAGCVLALLTAAAVWRFGYTHPLVWALLAVALPLNLWSLFRWKR